MSQIILSRIISPEWSAHVSKKDQMAEDAKMFSVLRAQFISFYCLHDGGSSRPQLWKSSSSKRITTIMISKEGRVTSSLRNALLIEASQLDRLMDDDVLLMCDEDVKVLSIPEHIDDHTVMWASYQFHDLRNRSQSSMLGRWPSTFTAAFALSMKTARDIVNRGLLFDTDVEHLWGFEDREWGGRLNENGFLNLMSPDFVIEGSPSDRAITPEDWAEAVNIFQTKNIFL